MSHDVIPSEPFPRPRLAVFCGSSHGHEPEYTRAAGAVGRALGERGWGLVYGGGNVGLMGVLADAALDAGAEVIGVIPHGLERREVAHRGLTSLEIVATMHERKHRMYTLADAVLALPGGIGTLEELFEAFTWGQLGIVSLPCGLLDVRGYYAPLVAMLDKAVDEGFLRRGQRERLLVDDDLKRLLDRLATYEAPPQPSWEMPGAGTDEETDGEEMVDIPKP
ncbi:MAG: TIGR00730 family Rossman fold protein [Acidobacteriota bacterium]